MSKSKRAQPREVTPVVNWTGSQAQRAKYAAGTIIFGQGDPALSIMYVERAQCGCQSFLTPENKKELGLIP